MHVCDWDDEEILQVNSELTASLQSIADKNSRSKRLSSTRLTPPTLANKGFGENASQNVFDRIVIDAMIKRWTLREEILKLGRLAQIWSIEWSMMRRTERCRLSDR